MTLLKYVVETASFKPWVHHASHFQIYFPDQEFELLNY